MTFSFEDVVAPAFPDASPADLPASVGAVVEALAAILQLDGISEASLLELDPASQAALPSLLDAVARTSSRVATIEPLVRRLREEREAAAVSESPSSDSPDLLRDLAHASALAYEAFLALLAALRTFLQTFSETDRTTLLRASGLSSALRA